MGVHQTIGRGGDGEVVLPGHGPQHEHVARHAAVRRALQAQLRRPGAERRQSARAQGITVGQPQGRSAGGERRFQHADAVQPRARIAPVQAERRAGQRPRRGGKLVAGHGPGTG